MSCAAELFISSCSKDSMDNMLSSVAVVPPNFMMVILYWFGTCPLNTWRNTNVVITSKRRHFDVITSKWRRFDVITTLLLRNVFAGWLLKIQCMLINIRIFRGLFCFIVLWYWINLPTVFKVTSLCCSIHHHEVIKCNHFPPYWLFVRGIHWSPVRLGIWDAITSIMTSL